MDYEHPATSPSNPAATKLGRFSNAFNELGVSAISQGTAA
jgi:hypothetical protein